MCQVGAFSYLPGICFKIVTVHDLALNDSPLPRWSSPLFFSLLTISDFFNIIFFWNAQHPLPCPPPQSKLQPAVSSWLRNALPSLPITSHPPHGVPRRMCPVLKKECLRMKQNNSSLGKCTELRCLFQDGSFKMVFLNHGDLQTVRVFDPCQLLTNQEHQIPGIGTQGAEREQKCGLARGS